MIRTPAEFPFPGSFALFVDTTLPVSEQRAELVRIQRLDPTERRVGAVGGAPSAQSAAISFPLRAGASANKLVPLTDLIDATPLTKPEERELTDLQDHLRGRDHLTKKMRAQQARADALKHRQLYSVVLAREVERLASLDGREVRRSGGSVGVRLPRAA